MRAAERVPIACTLDFQAKGSRLADIERLTHEHLRSHRLDGRVLHLVYDPSASMEVSRIVDLERVCCAFLDFRLESTVDAAELTISAPENATEAASWLFAQFLPNAEAVKPAGRTCAEGGCGS